MRFPRWSGGFGRQVMHWSLWVSCSMASALTLAGSAASGPPPAVRVLPGEARLEVAIEGPSPRWHGARVSLRAARGETLSVQVRVPPGGSPSTRLQLPEEAAAVTA